MKAALASLVAGQDLNEAEMMRATDLIMEGAASPGQIGAFLTALAAKGETVEELVAAVKVMRSKAVPIDLGSPLLDTCGTGGDGLGTFNISTATSFVAAAAGLRVAKHGNRAASGKVGAADVLEALGARIDLTPEAASRVLEATGLTFLFAPLYHPAVRHVGPVRRELGFRTIFNLTGPLSNPAGATHQLLGVFSSAWLRPVAEALGELGTARALVVHGSDGSDEITLTGPTSAVMLGDGGLTEFQIDPLELGFHRCDPADLSGGDAGQAANSMRLALTGSGGPLSEVVVINTAAALYVADAVEDVAEGVDLAREIVGSGRALETLDAFVNATREYAIDS